MTDDTTAHYQSHQLRFREFRKSLGLSQAEFGQKLGMSQVGISGIEAGKQDVTTRMLYDLADLDCNPNWLLLGSGPQRLSQIPTGATLEVKKTGNATEYIVRV